MGARQHRQAGMVVSQSAQGGQQGVQARQNHGVACLPQHQGIGEGVDVLGGAGEVDEFERRAEVGLLAEPFLDEVFDRLDIVVGRRFDRLDPVGVLDPELLTEGQQAGTGGRIEGRQFDDAGLVGECDQPGQFNPNAGMDQAEFGEDRPQWIGAGSVAAIDRGQGREAMRAHGRPERRGMVILHGRWHDHRMGLAGFPGG